MLHFLQSYSPDTKVPYVTFHTTIIDWFRFYRWTGTLCYISYYSNATLMRLHTPTSTLCYTSYNATVLGRRVSCVNIPHYNNTDWGFTDGLVLWVIFLSTMLQPDWISAGRLVPCSSVTKFYPIFLNSCKSAVNNLLPPDSLTINISSAMTNPMLHSMSVY